MAPTFLHCFQAVQSLSTGRANQSSGLPAILDPAMVRDFSLCFRLSKSPPASLSGFKFIHIVLTGLSRAQKQVTHLHTAQGVTARCYRPGWHVGGRGHAALLPSTGMSSK